MLRQRASWIQDHRSSEMKIWMMVLLLITSWVWPSATQNQTLSLLRPEGYAMRHLRYDLRIRDFYWPKNSDPCTSWRGVLCQDRHVVSIYLSGLKRTLAGMSQPTLVLDNLRRLPRLQLLNASGFTMLGTIPDWIGQMPALQVLDLSLCSINGSIPGSFAPKFVLQRLSLAGNNLTGGIPDTIGALSRLELLDLSGNLLNGEIPRGVRNLTGLTSLDLSNNILSGSIPREVGGLRSLKSLKLSDNKLTGSVPTEIGQCVLLQELVLSSNSLVGELPVAMGNLQNLTSLNLAFNNLTGFLTALERLKGMQTLNLSGNTFYGPLPGIAPQLSPLDVSNNYLNSTVPREILSSAKVSQNCFLNVSEQRSLSDCETFYNSKGLVFQNGSTFNLPTPMPTRRSKNRHLAPILGGTLGGLALILLLAALVIFIVKREWRDTSPKKKEEVVPPPQVQVQTSGEPSQPPPPPTISVKMSSIGERFTLEQLERATNSFSPSNFIKAGHSGDLYRGVLDGGVAIVVKRIEVSKMKKDLLSEELQVFGKASHTRLVPLLGHCLEHDEVKFLVYKYMPNGDLSQALHKKVIPSPPADILQSLDWITRLKIAIGAAEGLTYLHHECTPPLVHRDIQASSILLDDKFEVRLGSLSEARPQEGEAQPGLITRLLRLSHTEQGDQGSPTSCAYDVYCFGKVLLELVTGKLDISSSLDSNAADAWLEWALPLIDRHNKEGVNRLVDPSLIVDEDLLEEVWAMAIVAKLCLSTRPSKRPQIRRVLMALENPQRVIREENFSSSLRSRTSSHGSWNASLFGSWRHSSSENVIIPGMLKEESVQETSGKKHSGTSNSGGSAAGEQSFHRRPGSNEIFPEPIEDVS